MSYTIYNTSTGKISRTILGDRETALMQLQAGENIVEGNFDANLFYIDSQGNIKNIPPKPQSAWVWDMAAKQWIDPRSIDDLKNEKTAEINKRRTEETRSNFIFDGKQIALDELSRADIDGINGYVSLTGNLPSNFIGAWKAVDNTYVDILDVETWKRFYNSMVNKGLEIFDRTQKLKQLLQSATTAEEINAISWDMQLPTF